MSNSINISEIFLSLQGEGTYLGQPSLFVRTSGCNLRCRWEDAQCDTSYASWNPEQNMMPLEAVMAEVNRLRQESPGVYHVVVTGGEPTIQEHFAELIQLLKEDGLFITVESNGTTFPGPGLPIDLISLSPKLASSTPIGTEHEVSHRQLRTNATSLKKWVEHYNAQLKFVIFSKADEDEVKAILDQVGSVPSEKIFLMPEGVTMDQLREHAETCFQMALQNGWRYTPRAHIEIFGNRRGK